MKRVARKKPVNGMANGKANGKAHLPAPIKRGCAGHPLYEDRFAHMAEEACRLGATDADLARLFEVSTVTIWAWKSKHPDFLEALKVGKGTADERVKRALYQRAVGYDYEEEVVQVFKRTPKEDDPNQDEHVTVRETVTKHMPADVKAADIWLKNRLPEEFHERFQVHHSGNVNTGSITSSNVREVLVESFLRLTSRVGGDEAKVIEETPKETD